MVKGDTTKKVTIEIEAAKLDELNKRIEKIEALLEEKRKIKEDYEISELKSKMIGPRNDVYLGKATLAILKYIKDNQDKFKDEDEGITKQHVAKYMDKEAELLSRPTTLKAIEELLDHKIIKDDKKRDNARSRLILNPAVDFRLILAHVLTRVIKETQKEFEIVNEGDNNELINELLNTIDKFRKKENK